MARQVGPGADRTIYVLRTKLVPITFLFYEGIPLNENGPETNISGSTICQTQFCVNDRIYS